VVVLALACGLQGKSRRIQPEFIPAKRVIKMRNFAKQILQAPLNQAEPSPAGRAPEIVWRQPRVTNLREADHLLAAAEQTILNQQRRIAQLENLAMTDELTRLQNRRGLLDNLQHELAAAERDPQAAGVIILCDLNGFKRVNDTHGHAAGDRYLQAVAEVLVAEVRPSDVVARIGGDEFAILLKRIDYTLGMARLERLDYALHTHSLTWQGAVLPLAASFGGVAFQAGDQPDALLHAADMRLYAAKAKRKAQIG
jgi:diguanylate cyclase (GGDEF)-like protein